MQVKTFAESSAFLELAEPLLLVDEARHNLIFGIAGSLRDSPALYDEHRAWVVLDAGRPVGAALRTPPYNLVLARPASHDALAALVDALADEELPGVTGALPEVEDFAARRAAAHGEAGEREARTASGASWLRPCRP